MVILLWLKAGAAEVALLAVGGGGAFVAGMKEAFRRHSLPLMELMYSPLFESARSDPRIQELLRSQAELQKRTR
ncbi:MAG: hypothetical protein ABR888_04735 [Thermoplasmata archaeon]|jgi:hypothetical protein